MPVRVRPVSHRAIAAVAHARRNGLALANPVARPNIRIGPINIPITKKERHASAISKETLYRNKYNECRMKQLNKGKTVYPDDPKGKCKSEWKRWQKWRGKAGERAMKVAEQAEKRGRLSPEQAHELQADMARASADASIAQAVPPPADIDDAYLQEAGESLSVPSMPWVLLGGGALVGTLGLIVLLRR